MLSARRGDTGTSNAVVHLHHTQQLVQVHGSALQWFVDNFLKEAFLSEAENKRLIIDDLNKVFNAAGRNLVNQSVMDNDGKCCGHCNSKFRKNTKSAICANCSRSFHNNKNNKCLLVHTCPGNNTTSTQPSAFVTNVSPTQPTYSSTGSRVSVTFVPVTTNAGATVSTAIMQTGNLSSQSRRLPGSSSTSRPTTSFVTSSPATSASGPTPSLQSSSCLIAHVSDQALSNNPCPSGTHPPPTVGPVTLPVSASLVTSLPSTSQSDFSSLNPTALPFQSQTTATQKKKNTTSNLTNSVHEAEIAILKQELVIARTKMLQLEAENKDFGRKNTVLAETLKMYESEQNKELRRKYFGGHEQVNPAKSTNANTPPSSTDIVHGLAYSGPSQETVDRVINYLLDIIQKIPSCPSETERETQVSDPCPGSTSYPQDILQTSGQPCTSSTQPTSHTPPTSHAAEPHARSSPKHTTVITASPASNRSRTAINDDLSEMTIDELIDENQDLNF